MRFQTTRIATTTPIIAIRDRDMEINVISSNGIAYDVTGVVPVTQ
ncbi:MAG: hypothetical protein ACRECH_13390 [Nitrososphaerales archaeon]